MVIFSENPRISFPVNMSPKVLDLTIGLCGFSESTADTFWDII